jgi:hypothetical protein
MKKLFTLLVLVSQHAFSQSFAATDKVFLNERTISQEEPKVYIMKNGNYHRGYINNVPSAVMNDFVQKYDGAENISWVLNDKKIDGYFEFQGQDIVVSYKNGYLETTRKTYDSGHVSASIVRFLQGERSKGYTISKVIEIISEKNTLYEVMLLNSQRQHCVARLSRNTYGDLELIEKIYFTEPAETKL